ARRLRIVVQVSAVASVPGFAVVAKGLLELLEEIRLLAEVAEVPIPGGLLLGEHPAHLRAVVSMEAVAFDECGLEVLAPKDVLEGARDRRRPGAGGSGDRDDRMLDGHTGCLRLRWSGRVAEQAAPAEQRRVDRLAGLLVVPLDTLDLVARAEHEADALVQRCGLHRQHRRCSGARAPAGLFRSEE